MSLGCACSIGRRWPSYDTLPGVRLTVVVENRAGHGCSGAHGFAAWLEAGSSIILLIPDQMRTCWPRMRRPLAWIFARSRP